MAQKIFITRKIPDVGIKMLQDKGFAVDIYPKDEILSHKKLLGILKKGDYDGVISLITDSIDKSIFDIAPSVKIFSNYATGFDNIDLVEAKKHAVTITNAPSDIASESVAEHAIALMLTLAARIVEANEFVRKGKYKGWDPMGFIGEDILGKTLGIIGVGRIGSRVAHYAKGLGLNIIYSDVARNDNLEKECGAVFCNSVEELLPKSDFVSIHVPLMDSTHHLINEARLKMMKRTAYIINTSRGPVIDEKVLVTALQNKTIAGAGLDVFEFEPKLSAGLSKLSNVVLTPHIASASIEARNDMSVIAAQNIIDFVDGKTPKNRIV